MPGPITSSNMPINTIDPKTAEYMNKYASAGLSAGIGGKLPKAYDITQQQINNKAAGTKPTDIPVNAVDLDTLKTMEKTNPAAAERLRKSLGLTPVNTTGKALEVQAMGTKGPDTYNKAHALIQDAQDKAGITRSSEYNTAKREQEKAARELDNAKGFTHVAKYTPNQNPAEVKGAKTKEGEIKDKVNAPKEQPQEAQEPEEDKTEENNPEADTDVTNKEEPWFKGLSSTFYRDLGAMFRGQSTGNVHDVDAAASKDQARNWQTAAANRQMEAEASQQIANQNPYAEAGKQATVQNDAQNRQNVKKAGVLGAGAALARTTTNPDVASEKAREDQQRNVASQRREAADEMQRESTDAERIASEHNIYSRDNDNWTDTTDYQARGGNVNDAGDRPGLFDQAKEWWNKNFSKKENEPAKPGIDYNSDPRFQNNPPSDERIKDVVAEYAKGLDDRLANARMGWIKEDYESDGMPSEEDFMWLLDRAGKLKHNGREYDLRDDASFEGADDSVLDAYANHIKNYVYTYKPEATKIDQSIDPNQEHIGPMAQDIEQVNPACIKETPEGVKTVDTARLAMMNAGAIGDLARQMSEMSAKLNALVQGE